MSENLLQDRYVNVGNINTRFWSAGDKGPSVLLIHGIGCSVEYWRANIDAFGEGHRVYALDLPGFGRSDKPSVPYSVPYLAEFVRRFLGIHGIERAHLVGNSMGGTIALQIAVSRPDMVDKLVLVDALGFGSKVHMALRLMALPFIGERMMRPSRKGTENFLKTIFLDPAVVTDEMIDFALETDGLPGSGEAFLSTARSFGSVWGVKRRFVQSVIDNAHCLRCPTLVVWGKQDKILPVEHAHAAASAIANAKLRLFDACGHCPQLEHPAAFNSAALQFLAG